MDVLPLAQRKNRPPIQISSDALGLPISPPDDTFSCVIVAVMIKMNIVVISVV